MKTKTKPDHLISQLLAHEPPTTSPTLDEAGGDLRALPDGRLVPPDWSEAEPEETLGRASERVFD